jgi:hypothetical protein
MQTVTTIDRTSIGREPGAHGRLADCARHDHAWRVDAARRRQRLDRWLARPGRQHSRHRVARLPLPRLAMEGGRQRRLAGRLRRRAHGQVRAEQLLFRGYHQRRPSGLDPADHGSGPTRRRNRSVRRMSAPGPSTIIFVPIPTPARASILAAPLSRTGVTIGRTATRRRRPHKRRVSRFRQSRLSLLFHSRRPGAS